MTWWRTVGLVVGREVTARRRATLIFTALLATVALGFMAFLAAVTSGTPAPARLDPGEADEVLGFIGVIVLFMAIILTGQIILMGVAEEKSSRVAEVVLGAVRPRMLLLGKVIAIGCIGLFEVVLTGSLVLAAGRVLGTLELPPATGGALALVVLWFALGFAFYSTVYAAAGALVARHQNAGNAAGPINIVLMVGYFIGVISASGPAAGNPVLRAASLTPPLAPVTMPLRMIQGTAAPWEVAASIAGLVLASWGLVLLAERVYVGGLLSTGRTRIREALRNSVR